MAKTSAREIGGVKLPEINHIGVVVRNLDEALRRFSETLGIGPFRSFEASFPDAKLWGKPESSTLKIAFGNLGTVLFEVMEPLAGRSLHGEFLEKHGEGIQHIGFVVPDIQADLATLRANGLRIALEASIEVNQSYIAYVESDEGSAIFWELIQDSPAQQAMYQRLWDRTRRPA